MKKNKNGYLPCPFCGNTEIFHRWDNMVCCGDTVNCGATVETYPSNINGVEGSCKEWVRECWNRRVTK